MLTGLALISSAASLLRWSGPVFIISGVILVTILHWKKWRTWLSRNLFFGALSSAPFILWVAGRNFQLTHTLLGPRDLNGISPLENLAFSYHRISAWLLPNSATKRTDLSLIILIFVFILVIINKKSSWTSFARNIFRGSDVVLVIFIPIYFLFITLTTFTGDHIDGYDDRYQVVLFIPLMVLGLIIFDSLVMPNLQKLNRWIYALPIALALAWFAYQGFLTYRFVFDSRANGIAFYNIYNTANYQRSGFIDFLRGYSFSSEIPVYSNNAAAVYFYTEHQVDNSLNDPNNFIHHPAI
jgi:hypothetical protein